MHFTAPYDTDLYSVPCTLAAAYSYIVYSFNLVAKMTYLNSYMFQLSMYVCAGGCVCLYEHRVRLIHFLKFRNVLSIGHQAIHYARKKNRWVCLPCCIHVALEMEIV